MGPDTFYRSQNMFRVLKSYLRFLRSVVHTKRLFQVLVILRALLMFLWNPAEGSCFIIVFFLYFNVTSVFLRTLAFGYSFNPSSILCLYPRTQSWLLLYKIKELESIKLDLLLASLRRLIQSKVLNEVGTSLQNPINH